MPDGVYTLSGWTPLPSDENVLNAKKGGRVFLFAASILCLGFIMFVHVMQGLLTKKGKQEGAA